MKALFSSGHLGEGGVRRKGGGGNAQRHEKHAATLRGRERKKQTSIKSEGISRWQGGAAGVAQTRICASVGRRKRHATNARPLPKARSRRVRRVEGGILSPHSEGDKRRAAI